MAGPELDHQDLETLKSLLHEHGELATLFENNPEIRLQLIKYNQIFSAVKKEFETNSQRFSALFDELSTMKLEQFQGNSEILKKVDASMDDFIKNSLLFFVVISIGDYYNSRRFPQKIKTQLAEFIKLAEAKDSEYGVVMAYTGETILSWFNHKYGEQIKLRTKTGNIPPGQIVFFPPILLSLLGYYWSDFYSHPTRSEILGATRGDQQDILSKITPMLNHYTKAFDTVIIQQADERNKVRESASGFMIPKDQFSLINKKFADAKKNNEKTIPTDFKSFEAAFWGWTISIGTENADANAKVCIDKLLDIWRDYLFTTSTLIYLLPIIEDLTGFSRFSELYPLD